MVFIIIFKIKRSLGCVFYKIETNTNFFKIDNEIMNEIMNDNSVNNNNKILKIQKEILLSKEYESFINKGPLNKLISKMLLLNPTERYTINQVINELELINKSL